MSFFSALMISGSGLTSQQTRMDTISDNIANVNTLQTSQGGPYQREETVFSTIYPDTPIGAPPPPPVPLPNGGAQQATGAGVHVIAINADRTPGRLVYEPTNPLANQDGYVTYPNVNLITEVSDMMGASRAYQANATVVTEIKTMATKALDIGR